jgi:hypothetical protein
MKITGKAAFTVHPAACAGIALVSDQVCIVMRYDLLVSTSVASDGHPAHAHIRRYALCCLQCRFPAAGAYPASGAAFHSCDFTKTPDGAIATAEPDVLPVNVTVAGGSHHGYHPSRHQAIFHDREDFFAHTDELFTSGNKPSRSWVTEGSMVHA